VAGETMKNFALLFVMLGFFASLSGCKGSTSESHHSTFKDDFLINEVIENNRQLLLDEAWHSSGAESGPGDRLNQFHQETVVQIDPSNVLEFMTALRSDIQQSLIDSDLRILGSEAGSNMMQHFSFSYGGNKMQGSIHVWGILGRETEFAIITLITENE
jgi:hypothetical protein